MAKTLKIRRGNKADLPVLEEGELGLTLDEKKMYVGTGSENIALANETEINSGVSFFNWVKLNTDSAAYKVACADNLCVAINPLTGMCYRSNDGWNTYTSSTITNLKNIIALCGGGGKIIAIYGNSSTYRVSTDGVTWSGYTLPAALDWITISYANNRYILFASTTTFYYSTDGINWTTGTLPKTGAWKDVVYGNGIYIAYENNDLNYLISDNGLTWTAKQLNAVGPDIFPLFRLLIYANGMFIGGGSRNLSTDRSVFVSSTDGITWSRNYVDSNCEYTAGVYGNGLYALMGKSEVQGYQKILISNDGIHWTKNAWIQKFGTISNLICCNGTFVLTDTNGVYISTKTSTDFAFQHCYSEKNSILVTGSYIGTGTSNTIDIGFRPRAVIISQSKVYNAAPPVILRRETSTYIVPSSGSASVVVGNIVNEGNTGFTVTGNEPATNLSGSEYTYIAFR